jgi:hypothetical protein
VLEIRSAVPFELAIDLQLVVELGHDPDTVTSRLRTALGGLFEDGRFAMGQRVFASQIVTTAAEVEGVAAVQLTRFSPATPAGTATPIPPYLDVAPWAFAHLRTAGADRQALGLDLIGAE